VYWHLASCIGIRQHSSIMHLDNRVICNNIIISVYDKLNTELNTELDATLVVALVVKIIIKWSLQFPSSFEMHSNINQYYSFILIVFKITLDLDGAASTRANGAWGALTVYRLLIHEKLRDSLVSRDSRATVGTANLWIQYDTKQHRTRTFTNKSIPFLAWAFFPIHDKKMEYYCK